MPRFIVRKYIDAKDAKTAIKLDKVTAVQEVWIDEDWKKMNDELVMNQKRAIGFKDK